jgi:hypothetical protein
MKSYLQRIAVPPRNACVVLVPVGAHVEPACEEGLAALERRGYPVWRVRGYSAIDQGRNQMATDALAQGYAETMWIDADIAFNPDDVDRLRCLELPIACGIYPKKGKRELAIHVLPGTRELVFGERGGLLELKYAATGFLHVRREVYETMERELKLPRCNTQFGGNGMIPFFQPMVVGGEAPSNNGRTDLDIDSDIKRAARRQLPDNQAMRLTRVFELSNGAANGACQTAADATTVAFADVSSAPWYLAEDYAFCERARRCGYAIWADTRIRLGHIGTCQYTWEEAGTETRRFTTFTYRLEAEQNHQ